MTGEISARILTIEDEEIVRESIAVFLEDSGYDVLEAENGRQGLEVFFKERPDAVLVDLRMPEVDGLDVLAEVAAESPETPVIVVSGTGVLEDAVEALRRGAWNYVVKPIQDFGVLEHAVRTSLERARLRRENRIYQEHLEQVVNERTNALIVANNRLRAEIDERVAAEKGLKESLREKEILLKEIHHRVKNNLQIISSLLSLQSGYIEDPGALRLLTESRNRISSMALVHEELYQARDFSHIDLKAYADKLGRKLMSSYSCHNVTLDLDISDIPVTIDKAIPIGLIINELVSNALKHAFVGQEEGHISISLSGENDIVMSISDTGIGFPDNLDFRKTKSLGLQLVVSLVEQLSGKIVLDRTRGTSFIITFQLN